MKKKVNGRMGVVNRSKRITLILSIITLILLIIVILLFDKRFQELLSGPNGDSPVVERVPSGETKSGKALEKIPQVEYSIEKQNTGDDVIENNDEDLLKQNVIRLFFIRVSDDGTINTKSILRPVKHDKAPLTAAINALLNGPGAGDLSTDILSLIPEESRLLGARISDRIAFLNFNESFRFNSLGIEGYRAQVEQVVFTATEFPNVDKVQFLIESKTISYLGGEGIWVGSPLAREDF